MVKYIAILYNLYSFSLARARAKFWGLFVSKMGKDVFIMKHCEITSPQFVSIGDHAYIGNYVSICGGGGITIGEDVLIGAFSQIMSVTHEYKRADIPICNQPISSATVRIGKGAWIGTHVTVLPGITIGDGAIVGANSVVTHDVPAFSIVGGVPARFIKNRVEKRKKHV